jgi:hypothetical protein
MLWFALTQLHISRAEFWTLTPREFNALKEEHIKANKLESETAPQNKLVANANAIDYFRKLGVVQNEYR